jgi:Fe2+ transport system protein FeoA
MILSQVKSGKKVKLKNILANKEAVTKLSSMGLVPGVEFEVVKNDVLGPVIIAINNSQFILGRGISLKVDVDEL